MQFDASEFSSSGMLLCYYVNNTHEKITQFWLIGVQYLDKNNEADEQEQRRLSFAFLKTGSLYNAIPGFWLA